MKLPLKLSFFISLLLIAGSCGDNNICDCVPPPLRPISAGEQQIIQSSNEFSFDIFRRINAANQGKNLFISPLSISTALSMTANGAKGETKDGIKTTLFLEEMTDTEINEAYKSLAGFLMNLDPKVIMQLANSTWYSDEFRIKNSFQTILSEYYDADVRAADFGNPATKDLINAWIETRTNGKIKNMIDQIPAEAVMYLINAIYLKATWQYQFDKSKTEPLDFYLANGSIIKTETMYSEGVKANAWFQPDFQYVEIPYGNGQFVFSVIMPFDPGSLETFADDLDTEKFHELTQNAREGTFRVKLPKFRIEYKTSLNEVLAAMGMERSFTDQADFSEMFEEDLSLAISRVLHQSFIEVDEEGTEAAAATAVEMVVTSIGPDPIPEQIQINKPFIFIIREKHSDAILFAGKMLNPKEGK